MAGAYIFKIHHFFLVDVAIILMVGHTHPLVGIILNCPYRLYPIKLNSNSHEKKSKKKGEFKLTWLESGNFQVQIRI